MFWIARTPQDLSYVLRHARENLKLTKAEIAQRLGIHQEIVSTLEVRAERSSIETLLSILAELELELQIVPSNRVRPTDLLDVF